MRVNSSDVVPKILSKDKIYEAPESELVTHVLKRGDTCVDAGCQVGYYSCLFARLVGEGGRVYSFDANPQACEVTRANLELNNIRCAEVIHVALTDRPGDVRFHVASDDQTGLSSIGPIDERKTTITVPGQRLDDLLDERKVDHIRLLKLDVEGAEEIALRGLGRYLTEHRVDFILAECYDLRLQLLKTSTERVWAILHAAGYSAWQYQHSNGWLETTDVRSNGDCNYLFVSPAVHESIPHVSIVGALLEAQTDAGTVREALAQTQGQAASLKQGLDEAVAAAQIDGDRLRRSVDEFRDRNVELSRLLNESDRQIVELRRSVDEFRDRGAELSRLLDESTLQIGELRQKISDAEEALRAIYDSTGWRVLGRWRKMRDVVAPVGSSRRRIYERLIGMLRGGAP